MKEEKEIAYVILIVLALIAGLVIGNLNGQLTVIETYLIEKASATD